MQNSIFILHEYGEKSHYLALEYLAKEHNINIHYYEFACIKNLVKSISKKDFTLLKKQLRNCKFLLSLLFRKDKTIVIGIAPFDYRLIFLKFFLSKHKIYYHTSWPYWDEVNFPKKKFVNNLVIKFWKNFLQNIKYIFSVTSFGKQNLQKYIHKNNISVVYHSFDKRIFFDKNLNREIDYLYVGRLIYEKGIEELLEIFSKRKETLLIAGDGELKKKVEIYASKFSNIIYIGKKNKKDLSEIYNKSKFFILNSKKTKSWEELFGMVLIESMACGCIPIAVNHIGPNEIVVNGKSGILFKEGNLKNILNEKKHFLIKKEDVIKRSKMFEIKNIKKRWKKIL